MVDTSASERKSFFSANGVVFERRDIVNDPSAMAELVKIGVMTTPVTVVDGDVVVGFDRKKLEELLSD